MPVEGVALIPRCVECEAAWLPVDDERWRAYLKDDEPAEVAFYCRDCAERDSARTDARARDESETAMAASAGGRGMGQMGLSLQTGAAT